MGILRAAAAVANASNLIQESPLTHRILISTATLAEHLFDPDWLVADCRFDLANPEAGESAWLAGHIPGAIYAHLDRDLSTPVTASSGRHPLPPIDELAATMSRFGVSERTQVVCYDAGNGAYAARLWWILRYLGHEAVAVLDGGLGAWIAEGRPLSTDHATRPPADFVPRPRPEMLGDVDDVANAPERGDVVVDVRAAERFAGTVEPIDPVAGHVPGAVNVPFIENLGPDGRFLSEAELADNWRARVGDTAGDSIICMCGSGVTACQGLLALEAAGIEGARLYAGSWSEWIRDPSRPVAVGEAPPR